MALIETFPKAVSQNVCIAVILHRGLSVFTLPDVADVSVDVGPFFAVLRAPRAPFQPWSSHDLSSDSS
jgi:hypothetical protein